MAGLSTGTTATTTQAKEVCIGCIGFDISDNFVNPSNSFTEITEASGAPDLVVLERIVSATGTYGTTVDWFGAVPLAYALCGAIATFKSNGVDGIVNISTSTATASAPSVSVSASSSKSISTSTASGTMPNVNVQAGAQTTISVSTATSAAPSPTVRVDAAPTIAVSTATATLLSIVENHGSSVYIVADTFIGPVPPYFFFEIDETITADAPAVTTAVSTDLSTMTATADTPAISLNISSNISIGVMTAEASMKDPVATVSSTGARRIIISNS